MKLDILLPNISDLILERVEMEEDYLKIITISQKESSCPICKTTSRRIHSNYTREVADLPWASFTVKIILKVHKFFCKENSCKRNIFSQRFDGILPYARRTERQRDKLISIGMAAGGNVGSKLSKDLGLPISASTILRLLYSSTGTEDFETPRVLGVDDWAFRRGRNYGTILVDLEKQKPVDLLPDREAATLEAWLKAHPGVEIISRDRASAYSTGAKAGAPNAIQVADRWHLLKNLGDAIKRMLDTYNKELRLAAKEIAQSERDKKVALVQKKEKKIPSIEQEVKTSKSLNESRHALNFLEVKRLKEEDHSIKSIRRQTGLHRQTIKKYLKYDEYPEPSPGVVPPVRDYEDYIQKRWKEGERNGKQLWREIQEQGYKGSFQSVYRIINKYPKDQKEKLPSPLKIRAWSAKKVSILLGKDFEELKKEEQEYLNVFVKHCPDALKANSLAKEFKEMTDKLKVKLLDPWLEKAKTSGITALKNFAIGLERDYDAIKAAVSLKWSNGQVEGQVNRLKNIKRQMYGRGSFELLKKKVLSDW